MKKFLTVFLVLIMAFSLFGCSGNKQTSFDIKIVIPAGSQEDFVFSDEEISPVGNEITITPLEGISDAEFCLDATEGNDIAAIYPPMTITTGTSFERKVEDKAWYRLGIKMNNDTDADKIVYIRVEPVEVRIEDGISNSLPQDADVNPMVMVDGKLYIATGKESTITARCGVMDGEIISSVDRNTIPTQDNQSNFGDGYGYQYGADETIEVCIDGKWYVYATEDSIKQQLIYGALAENEEIFINSGMNWTADAGKVEQIIEKLSEIMQLKKIDVPISEYEVITYATELDGNGSERIFIIDTGKMELLFSARLNMTGYAGMKEYYTEMINLLES